MKRIFVRILALSLSLCCVLLAACNDASSPSSPSPSAEETSSPVISPSSSPFTSPLPSPGDISMDTYEAYYAAYQKPVGGDPLDIPTYPFVDLTDWNKSNFTLHFDYGQWVGLSGTQSFIFKAIQAFPTTAIRYFPENPLTMYFVYDTDIGARVFLFDNLGGFILKHFCIIMMKKLSHADFASLKVGDAVEKVAAIDPIVPFYREKFDEKQKGHEIYKNDYDFVKQEENDPLHGNCAFYTLHLLTDGILRVGYSSPKEGEYIIKSIEFNDDFSLVGFLARYDMENYSAQNFRIDPQDYVD